VPPSSCAAAVLERVDYSYVLLTNLTTNRIVQLNSISRAYL
jgi:hypothetical protein